MFQFLQFRPASSARRLRYTFASCRKSWRRTVEAYTWLLEVITLLSA